MIFFLGKKCIFRITPPKVPTPIPPRIINDIQFFGPVKGTSVHISVFSLSTLVHLSYANQHICNVMLETDQTLVSTRKLGT